MAFTYYWRNLVDEVGRHIGTMPVGNWPLYCDMVSSDMYTAYPWRDTLQTVAEGQIPLVDGQQDYDVPTNIYRLTKVSIARVDVSPVEVRELDTDHDLDVDLVPRSWAAIRACSLQAGAGQLRLDSAIQVPSGVTLELRGEYQINSPKVASLTDALWFGDQYIPVAFAGLLYWGFKLAKDERAGTASASAGRQVFTGQLGEYKAFLDGMKAAEDFGNNDTYYPSESMGADKGSGLPLIFGGGR